MTVGSVGSHLEYICTELLKNAFRATIEHNVPKKEEDDPDVFKFDDLPHAHMMKDDFPEVLITIGTVPGAMTIRIRDRGGGVRESAPFPQATLWGGGPSRHCESSGSAFS
jgi:hypothetical protein